MMRQRQRAMASLIIGILLAELLGSRSTTVQAGTGSVAFLPARPKKATSGLRLSIDTRWVDGSGYRPGRVRLSMLNGLPAPADRMVKVLLRPNGIYGYGGYYGMRPIEVNGWVKLRQGDRFGETVLSTPQYGQWWTVKVVTREDGKLIDELSDSLGVVRSNNYEWSEATPTMLVIDSDAPDTESAARLNVPNPINTPNSTAAVASTTLLPDIRVLVAPFQLNDYNSGVVSPNDFDVNVAADDNDILRLLNHIPKVEILPPDALFDRWIDYSSLDIVILSFSDLEKLKQDAATWEAIRRWLAFGPTLCVYDVGDGFQRLNQLEEYLQLGLLVEGETSQTRGWQKPAVNDYRESIDSATNST
jgi:hypothetical protein